ncbi:TcpD family membrane protein [Mammaliicoccus sp. B-M10]|uniref:TcpD family membrane protein n=1 Tax=Mammaliicoccus sp. B-M10 TaxID=2898670 RepID=UPI001EFC0E7E|nr:TcpD family membrane protein [Mammaliicoccus sp. B-M10]
MLDLLIFGSQQPTLSGGLAISKEEIGNALAIVIGAVALFFALKGQIGRMFGFLIVAAVVWIVVGDPKGFLNAVGSFIKAIVGL